MNGERTYSEVMKRKLEVLDALRGFCAIIVVALHFSENYIKQLGYEIIPHGLLPVEYFLMLTGFTFVYAYDGRWDGMTVGQFFRRRLMRMHPLVVVGSVIGALCFLIIPEQYARWIPGGHLSLGGLLLLTLWCCTLLPAPGALGWSQMCPLQGPLWTMFYIYLANVLYAFVLRHLKTTVLVALTVLAAGYTCFIAQANGGFHTGPTWRWTYLFDEGRRVVWWGNCGALARMLFPVLAGMVIARKGWKIRTGNAGLWICLALLSAIFFTPDFRPDKTLEGLISSALVIVGMPLVLLCGIGGEIRNATLASVCRTLGRFSFPLYATHYPLTLMERAWAAAHPDAPLSMHLAVVGAFTVFAAINAYVALRLMDWFAEKAGKR